MILWRPDSTNLLHRNMPLCVNVKTENGGALCVLSCALLWWALMPASALAATMSLSRAQAAAARGDQQAAAALATTTSRQGLYEWMRLPRSSERSIRQRLPSGHLPHRRQGALLRGKVVPP
jgi:hypothetical protein